MTIDPAVLIGTITALAGLIGYTFRLFLTGAILPRSAVPREDYDVLVAAIPLLTEAVNKAVAIVTAERARNGSAT